MPSQTVTGDPRPGVGPQDHTHTQPPAARASWGPQALSSTKEKKGEAPQRSDRGLFSPPHAQKTTLPASMEDVCQGAQVPIRGPAQEQKFPFKKEREKVRKVCQIPHSCFRIFKRARRSLLDQGRRESGNPYRALGGPEAQRRWGEGSGRPGVLAGSGQRKSERKAIGKEAGGPSEKGQLS